MRDCNAKGLPREAFMRIPQRHLLHVRLIYVMRHPIDRLGSHCAHDWTWGKISLPIDQATCKHPELIAHGRYSMQLKAFMDAYAPQQILPVFFERLVCQPQAELERVYCSIGCTHHLRWVAGLGASNTSRERLRKSRVRDVLVRNPVSTRIRQRLIPQSWRNWAKGLWQMKERPVLSPASRARLTETFDEDLDQLGVWLGMSLSCESFKARACAGAPEWRGLTMELPT